MIVIIVIHIRIIRRGDFEATGAQRYGDLAAQASLVRDGLSALVAGAAW